jgi:hypothetical protein
MNNDQTSRSNQVRIRVEKIRKAYIPFTINTPSVPGSRDDANPKGQDQGGVPLEDPEESRGA